MKRIRSGAGLVFCFSILFVLFFQFSKHNPVLGPANPFNQDPYDAVGSFGTQLAVLSAGLALLRAFRPYPEPDAPPAQLVLILRSGIVALLAVAVTLIADAIGLVRSIVEAGTSLEAWILAVLLAGMAFLNLLVGWLFQKSFRKGLYPDVTHPWSRAILILVLGLLSLTFYPLWIRDASVAGALFTIILGILYLFLTVWSSATAIFPELDMAYEDLFDDLAAIYKWMKKRYARLSWLYARIEKASAIALVQRLVNWLNPRSHRWNLIILLAIAVGIGLALAEAIGEGLPGNPRLGVLVLSVYIGMEMAAVAVGYLLLGEYLGIYRIDKA